MFQGCTDKVVGKFAKGGVVVFDLLKFWYGAQKQLADEVVFGGIGGIGVGLFNLVGG